MEYIYNAEGQRTRKILYNAEGTITQTIIYHWSMGMLVEETTATGELIRDYIPGTSYMPVAQIDVHQSTEGNSTEQVLYLYADHLDTPRLATNSSQAVVWRWDSDAFGGGGDPVSTAIAGQQDTVINLRFPGQYHDVENGLYYNYHRNYAPSTGRYISSDPVGLAGGINTYAYAVSNPIIYLDPSGLKTYLCRRPLGATKADESAGQKTGPEWRVNPLYHQYTCADDPKHPGRKTCGGQTAGKRIIGLLHKGAPSEDYYHPVWCREEDEIEDNLCLEQCFLNEWKMRRPLYRISGIGTNCQEYDDGKHKSCKKRCGIDTDEGLPELKAL